MLHLYFYLHSFSSFCLCVRVCKRARVCLRVQDYHGTQGQPIRNETYGKGIFAGVCFRPVVADAVQVRSRKVPTGEAATPYFFPAEATRTGGEEEEGRGKGKTGG